MDEVICNDDQGFVRAMATFRPSSVNVEARTVEVTMSSETAYTRRSYDGHYSEVLSHEAGHVNLERMQNGAPVLDNHDRFGSVGRNQIGVVDAVRLDTNTRETVATIRFSRKPEADVIFQDIVDGIVRNFSIGYTVHRYVDTKFDDPNTLDIRRITSWTPFELSVVTVPADHTAQVRSSDNDNFNTSNNSNNVRMEPVITADGNENTRSVPTTPATQPVAPVAPAAAPVDVEAIRAAERARIRDIENRLEVAGIDDSTFARTLVDGNYSPTELTEQIRTRWQAAQTTTPNASSDAAVRRDDSDTLLVQGLTDAISYRAGVTREAPSDNARQYVGMSMPRMAEAILAHRGVNTRGMSQVQLVEQAFRRDGFHSSTDFPIIFNNVINRSLQAAYTAQPRTYMAWTAGTTHSDFRIVEKARLSELVGALDLVPEGGEYKQGTFNESVEGYAVQKYGKLISYTWEMAINDNLGFIRRVPQALAREVARNQNDIVYAILTGNPNMANGLPVFSVANKNLMTGSAITDAALNTAKTMFRLQTDREGKFIRVEPKYLLVGPSREFEAKKILNLITPNKVADVNLHANTLELIVDPAIGDAWFLAADPQSVDTIEYAFLQGQPELYTKAEESFHVDATVLKARTTFGARFLDHVGMLMNPGA